MKRRKKKKGCARCAVRSDRAGSFFWLLAFHLCVCKCLVHCLYRLPSRQGVCLYKVKWQCTGVAVTGAGDVRQLPASSEPPLLLV